MNEELVIKDKFESQEAKDWLWGVLKEGVVTIAFTKVDGTHRVMKSTLKPELLPVVEPKPVVEGEEPKPKKKQSEATVRAFDVEKQDWRSIRWDSISSINFKI
jgi:hypothetical protein